MSEKLKYATFLFAILNLFVLVLAGASGDPRAFQTQIVTSEPVERGLVTYHEGHERVVFELVHKPTSEGTWFVALPNVPLSVCLAEPLLFDLAASLTAPEIDEGNGQQPLFLAVFPSALFVVLFSRYVLTAVRSPKCFGLNLYCLVFLMAGITCLLDGPSGRCSAQYKKRGMDIPQKVEERENFHWRVITPEETGHFAEILTSEGMSLPSRDKALALEKFSQQGWSILAVASAKTGSGAGTQALSGRCSGLMVEFSTDQLVYPRPIYCEGEDAACLTLFVVADSGVHCADFSSEYCQKFFRTMTTHLDDADESLPYFDSNYGCVGIPLLSDLMWEHCVFTRLAGNIRSQGGDAVLKLNPGTFHPFRLACSSRERANSIGILLAACCANIGLATGAFLLKFGRISTKKRAWWVLSPLSMAALLGLITWGGWYCSVAKVELRQVPVLDLPFMPSSVFFSQLLHGTPLKNLPLSSETHLPDIERAIAQHLYSAVPREQRGKFLLRDFTPFFKVSREGNGIRVIGYFCEGHNVGVPFSFHLQTGSHVEHSEAVP